MPTASCLNEAGQGEPKCEGTRGRSPEGCLGLEDGQVPGYIGHESTACGAAHCDEKFEDVPTVADGSASSGKPAAIVTAIRTSQEGRGVFLPTRSRSRGNAWQGGSQDDANSQEVKLRSLISSHLFHHGCSGYGHKGNLQARGWCLPASWSAFRTHVNDIQVP